MMERITDPPEDFAAVYAEFGPLADQFGCLGPAMPLRGLLRKRHRNSSVYGFPTLTHFQMANFTKSDG
jgi:hypothetical protein